MFMQPQVYFGQFFRVETSQGTEIVPADVVRLPFRVNFQGGGFFDSDAPEWKALQRGLLPYIEANEVESISPSGGWLARMSAPGYMDCTPWVAYDSEAEAWESLIDMHADDEMYCEWLPAAWEGMLGETTIDLEHKADDMLRIEWQKQNHTLDFDSAFAVGEVRAMGFANGTQDARLFVFRVISE